MKNILSLFVIISLFAISCNSSKEVENKQEEHNENENKELVVLNKKQVDAINLKLDTFQMRNLTTVVKVNGQLEVPPKSRADITTFIGGNVKEIKVFLGDKVKKGQVLAVLEHLDYISLQEDFAEVANKLGFFEKEYKRQKELFENNVGAGRDFQKIKADYRTEKAKYQGLKSKLELLNISPEKVLNGKISKTINILSPIDGYITDVYTNIGTYIESKDKLFSISDNSNIHADFMVYEKDIHLLKIGQKIDFVVANRPGEELSAVIFAIGKEFENNTRAVHIHARLINNPGNLIRGMYISGQIHTDQNYTRALPNDAIVKEGTKSYIFIQDNEAIKEHLQNKVGSKNGNTYFAFKMVEVVTGQKDAGYTAIRLLDSLPKNTRVVMNVAYYLLADMKKGETGDDD